MIFSHTPDLTITLIMANVTIHTPTETIFIDMVPKEDAVKLVEFVSRHIVTPENSGDSYNHKEECVDIVNQLERLAALKEKGLLTEDEFTTKKIKLLAR